MIEPSPAHAGHRRPLGGTLRLAAAPDDAPERGELEAFVRAAFQRGHGATVNSFMPTLLSFRDGAGQLRGVVGLRGATPQALYLEPYLEQAVEVSIATATGHAVRREQIVEVGNLAGSNCRAAMRMVAQLPAYLLAHDFRWIVFTATTAVHGICSARASEIRFRLIPLATGDAQLLRHLPDAIGLPCCALRQGIS